MLWSLENSTPGSRRRRSPRRHGVLDPQISQCQCSTIRVWWKNSAPGSCRRRSSRIIKALACPLGVYQIPRTRLNGTLNRGKDRPIIKIKIAFTHKDTEYPPSKSPPGSNFLDRQDVRGTKTLTLGHIDVYQLTSNAS